MFALMSVTKALQQILNPYVLCKFNQFVFIQFNPFVFIQFKPLIFIQCPHSFLKFGVWGEG